MAAVDRWIAPVPTMARMQGPRRTGGCIPFAAAGRNYYTVKHSNCENVNDMKNITVSVDEETYRMARITAAERGTSVSALVREYLSGLTNTELRSSKRTLREIVADIHARGGGINPAENLSREDLYDRDTLR